MSTHLFDHSHAHYGERFCLLLAPVVEEWLPLTTTMLFVFVKAPSETITFYKKAWTLAQARMEEVLQVACKPENYHHCHASRLRKAGTGINVGHVPCAVDFSTLWWVDG